jgi:hypothetical protein
MVTGFTNPFQQDFSEAEDFINILRQANQPFDSFDHFLIDELLPLSQVADSWVHLALQSFAPAVAGIGDSQITAFGQGTLNSSVAAPSTQDFGGTIGTGETQGVQVPYGTLLNPSAAGGGSSIGTGGLSGAESPYGTLLNPILSGGGGLSAWTGTSYGMLLPVSPI